MRQNKKARDSLKKIDHEGGFSQEKAQVVKVSFQKAERPKVKALLWGLFRGEEKPTKNSLV